MNYPTGSAVFDSRTTWEVLRAACAQVGLPCDDAELLRLGENAIYGIARQGTVVRIARTMEYWEDARKEVAVAGWLEASGFPAARLIDLPQPISVEGHPVTFWSYIKGRVGAREDIRLLGGLLRRLHATPAPVEFTLPVENILGRIKLRVEIAPVPDADKKFLLRCFEELDQELRTLEFPLNPGPTHGDAHTGNLMVPDGVPILIDFERFAWGQPEWDLSLTATEYRSAGWWTDREYELFSREYGYDVMSWTGFPVLRATHEIKMTTWLMQNVAESQDIANEYRVRMGAIRDGKRSHMWRPF